MPGLEGTRLGAYELLARIGGGGMAEVYRARQSTAFGREVAVKVIRPGFSENEDFRARFLREAQAISRLSHPNILPLIEFGEEQGMLYLVMPLAREGTLRDLIKQRNGPLPPEEAIPLFLQLCSAVQYAHEQGIVHRDLKPQNVLLQQRTHVLLADFGIARDSSVETNLTATGTGIGTVEYMAPEQAIGQADARSDIYSLGIVLYQLLTGSVPYSGSTPFQILLKHTNEQLPDPRAFNPNLPAEMVEVLRIALAKNAQNRFQSAQALARAVQRVQPNSTQSTGAAFPAIAVLPPDASMLSNRETARPPAVPDGEETRSGPAPSRLTIGPQPITPTVSTTPPPPVVPFPAYDDAAPQPPSATGVTFRPPGGDEPPPSVPGRWASAPEPANDWNDLPTMGYTNAGQQRLPGGAPRSNQGGLPPYRGPGQPVPQPPVKRNRRTLVVALVAALLLIVIVAGGAFAIFGPGSKSPNNTANSPTNTTQASATATNTATATATPSPTATDTPQPTATDTPVPPTATPVPIISQGTWTLQGTYDFDFDAGAQTSSGADVWWNQQTSTARYMTPINSAKIVNLGTVNFNSITKAQLQGYSYSTTPIDGSTTSNQLVNGDVFAVYTTNGHYAKVIVLSYGYNIQIQWVTY